MNLPADNIRIILVEPSHPGNIGAVARAMKNMALKQLWLVAPDHFPDKQATARAASAVDVLERAVVSETLEDAAADCKWLVATSARQRRIPWPIAPVREATRELLARAAHYPVGIVFGREERGLSNAELQLCNQHMVIPTAAEYPALNLAMAVQIVCHELFQHSSGADVKPMMGPENEGWDTVPASPVDMTRLLEHLERVLEQRKFLNPRTPRQLRARLRRMLTRLTLDEMEVRMLRGIIRAFEENPP